MDPAKMDGSTIHLPKVKTLPHYLMVLSNMYLSLKVNEGPLQMQITSLDYSSFLGRIAVGKVTRGAIKENQPIALVQADGTIKKIKSKRTVYI